MIKSKSNLRRISKKKLYKVEGNIGDEVVVEETTAPVEGNVEPTAVIGGEKPITMEQYALMYSKGALPNTAFGYRHGYRTWGQLGDININQEYVEAFHVDDQSKTIKIPTAQYLFGIIENAETTNKRSSWEYKTDFHMLGMPTYVYGDDMTIHNKQLADYTDLFAKEKGFSGVSPDAIVKGYWNAINKHDASIYQQGVNAGVSTDPNAPPPKSGGFLDEKTASAIMATAVQMETKPNPYVIAGGLILSAVAIAGTSDIDWGGMVDEFTSSGWYSTASKGDRAKLLEAFNIARSVPASQAVMETVNGIQGMTIATAGGETFVTAQEIERVVFGNSILI